MIGFVVAAGTAGLLAEHGGLRTHARAVLTMVVALLPVYVIGLAWLSFHVPVDEVAAAKLWPFLPGEAAKVGIAVLLTARSVR
jgi:biotin transporter BioY